MLRAVPAAADRRHRADASGGRRRHARRGGVRAVDAVALRAAGRRPPHRPRRPAVQPVQPDPPAARALRRDTRPTASSASPSRCRRRGGARRCWRRARRRRPTGRAVQRTESRSAPVRARRRRRLLDADAAERAEVDGQPWIKQLRHARVDGADVPRSVHASRRLALVVRRDLPAQAARHRPRRFAPSYALRAAALGKAPGARWDLDGVRLTSSPTSPRQVAATPRHRVRGHQPWRRSGRSRHAGAPRRVFHTVHGDGGSPAARAPRRRPATGGVVAFVHSAFARGDAGEEAYVGPGRCASSSRALGAGRLSLVGLGPAHQLPGARLARSAARVRRSRLPATSPLTPVDAFARWRDARSRRDARVARPRRRPHAR